MNRIIDKLSIDLDGVGHAISDNKFVVPVYQRSYAWEDRNIIDFYSDIFSSIQNSDDEYFIGSIVISSNNGQNEVVDGQQRLSTTSILFAAIRDKFIELGDDERARKIQEDYLANTDLRSQEIIPNLSLNSDDNDYYYKRILLYSDESKISPTKLSHEKILLAFTTAKKFINNYLENLNDKSDALLDICEYITDNLRFIIVRVPDHANAFTIFETLNDRGLDLAISDLLKNYLLGKSENRLKEVADSWTKMFGYFEAQEKEDLVVTFIRHYWSSQKGITREKDLYIEIKKTINSKTKAVEFVKKLEETSKIYLALIEGNNPFWSEYSDETKSNIGTLNMLKMIQIRPLMISVIQNFTKKDIEKTLNYLVSISVRFLVHGGLGGGALETQYSTRAKEISEKEITTLNQLKDVLKKVIPSDIEFGQSFSKFSVSKAYLARYYLSEIEQTLRGEESEMQPIQDTTKVNLEHILSKNVDINTWGIDEEEHRLLINRLGNQTIINSKVNSSIGNDTFVNKKKLYESSEIIITKKISKEINWGAKEIEKRQDFLSTLAIKRWKI